MVFRRRHQLYALQAGAGPRGTDRQEESDRADEGGQKSCGDGTYQGVLSQGQRSADKVSLLDEGKCGED